MPLTQDALRIAELEAALIEYAERYGLTDKARQALSRAPETRSLRVLATSMTAQ